MCEIGTKEAVISSNDNIDSTILLVIITLTQRYY